VDAGPERSRRLALVRLAGLVAVLAIIAVATVTTGSVPAADAVRDFADGFGAAGFIVYVPLSVTLSCLLVPGPVLAGAAGLLFGPALGTVAAITAATLASVAQLTISRRVAGGEMGALVPVRLRRLDSFIERRGFLAVLYLRLAPLSPFAVANYASGLTRLRARDMAAGTAVGAAPRAFAYAALGGSLDDLGSIEAKVAFAVLVVFGLLGLLLGRRQSRVERDKPLASGE